MKGLSIFLLGLILLYLPYGAAGGKVTGFLPIYFTNSYESFNLGLKYFLMYVYPGLDYHFLTLVFGSLLLAAALFVLFQQKVQEQVFRYAFFLIGLQIILMPVALHAWYVLAIIPFLAFFPNPALLLFSGLVFFSYLKYASPAGVMPIWVLLLEYLPLFSILAAEFLMRQRFGQVRFWPTRKYDLPGVRS